MPGWIVVAQFGLTPIAEPATPKFLRLGIAPNRRSRLMDLTCAWSQSVQNAIDQAKCAAAALAGKPSPAIAVPQDGMSVMEVAVAHNVPEIEADCGGACATCHVYIDAAWMDKLPPETELEQKMLEFATAVKPQSRLSCRLAVDAGLNGLLLTVPASQY